MSPIKKQGGFILTTELVILTTILAIGSILGFAIMRDAVVTELLDIADSIEAKNQYAFDGIKKSELPSVNQSQALIWVAPTSEGETPSLENASSANN